MRSIVGLFKYWVNVWQQKPNNPNSVQNVSSQGSVSPQNGELMQYSEENSELATITRHADSWLGGFLKRTPLKLMFIV